jgi:PX domain
MDYSNVPGSPDLHGQSPWGSSSPRASRTSFAPSEDPPSPSTPSRDQTTYQPQAESPPNNFSQNPSSGHQQHAEQEQLPPPLSEVNNDQTSDVQQSQQPQQKPGAARYQAARQHRQPPQYRLQAKITALERTGRKDPVLRFDVHVRTAFNFHVTIVLTTCQTNLPKFRTTQFRDVRRTHSEFEKLAEHLISSNPEAIVPAVPPALTSAGAGTDEDETRVKSSLQRWLTYVCGNDVLMRDEEMVFFVESDFGYSPVVKMKQPATGVRRKMLKQFAPPPDDTPELHEARPVVKLFYLGALDAEQKMEKVVKARRCRFLLLPPNNKY